MIREHFDCKVSSWRKDSCGRILSLCLEIDQLRLNVINIYAPVNLTDRKDFFETRGLGLWKFNNSLIDDVFCNFIACRIADLIDCQASFSSIKFRWDFFKESLSKNVTYSKEKRRYDSCEHLLITNRLIQLKCDLVQGFNVSICAINSLEVDLLALNTKALEGVKFRSRARWLEEGEKPSRFFFKMERERIEKNFVSSIYDSNGTEVSSREDVELAHVQFYTTLFSSEPIDNDAKSTLLNEVRASLSQPDCDSCEGNISLDELSRSLKTINTGKAPGLDGLSV